MNAIPTLFALLTLPVLSPGPLAVGEDTTLHVDPEEGRAKGPGDKRHPFDSISAALAAIAEPVVGDWVIELAPGRYDTTGGVDMPERSLQLAKPMRPEARIRLRTKPERKDEGERALFAWKGERRTVHATEGRWVLEDLGVGSFDEGQVRGVYGQGPVEVTVRDVNFELRSRSDAALWAERGARIAISGAIRINDRELGDPVPKDSYSCILATDGGVVEVVDKSESSLVMGNGSLRTSYWGSIRLGCPEVRLTCHTDGNVLSIGNSGRIDLRNSETTLHAVKSNNTPIGLEHDGHVLAEDAVIRIRGKNDSAIALQKFSTLTCNDIYLEGEFRTALWASSGSMFVGRFKSDVGAIEAVTGASVNVEAIEGELHGEVTAASGGIVSLPGRVVSAR